MRLNPFALSTSGKSAQQLKLDELMRTSVDIDTRIKSWERRTDYAELAAAKLRVLDALKKEGFEVVGDPLKEIIDDLTDNLAGVKDDIRIMNEDPFYNEDDPDIPRLKNLQNDLEEAIKILENH